MVAVSLKKKREELRKKKYCDVRKKRGLRKVGHGSRSDKLRKEVGQRKGVVDRVYVGCGSDSRKKKQKKSTEIEKKKVEKEKLRVGNEGRK